MTSTKPTVLVTAVGAPPGLNTVRSLLETNRFHVIAADADITATGLYHYDIPRYALPPAHDYDAYLHALKALVDSWQIDAIIPCIEEETRLLSDAWSKQTWLAGRLLLPEPAIVDTACNKWLATSACRKTGLATPASIELPAGLATPELDTRVETFASDTPPPWIYKPVTGHGMRGVYRAASVREVLELHQTGDTNAILQQCIPGRTGSMHLVGLLYDHEGRVRRRFCSRSIKTLYADGGPATGGETLPLLPIVEYTEHLISAIGGWRGVVCAEWMHNPDDDRFYFIELNPRMWGYSYLAHGAGSPFAPALADLILGRDPGPDTGYRTGAAMLRSTIDVMLDAVPRPLADSLQ